MSILDMRNVFVGVVVFEMDPQASAEEATKDESEIQGRNLP